MVDSCSVLSKGSCGSKYRTISCGSSIDRSLFKDNRKKEHCKRLGKIRAKEVSSVTIKELDRIRQYSSGIDNESSRKNTINAISNEKAMEKSIARNNHMASLEMKAKNSVKNTGSSNYNAKREAIRKDAREKINESEDIVKLMNTCCQRAATFTIRDKQLEDKMTNKKKETDYESLMNLQMEVDRLKAIETRDEEEKAKIDTRIEYRKVLEQQIQQSSQKKLLKEESRDCVNKQMLGAMMKCEKENEEKEQNRKLQAKQAHLQIIKKNEEIAAIADAQKVFDKKKEEEAIIAYQVQRDETLRKREKEEHHAKLGKVELQNKLLDNQIKSIDKLSELEVLRCRRAAEEVERKHRQQELFKARKRKKDQQILLEARKQQEQERYDAKAKDRLEKQIEYNDTMKQASEMAERERSELERAKKNNTDFRKMLQKQIEEKDQNRRRREQEKYAEGKLVKEKMYIENTKLTSIREKMMVDMKSKGINEKYFGEMKSLDIKKILMK